MTQLEDSFCSENQRGTPYFDCSIAVIYCLFSSDDTLKSKKAFTSAKHCTFIVHLLTYVEVDMERSGGQYD